MGQLIHLATSGPGAFLSLHPPTWGSGLYELVWLMGGGGGGCCSHILPCRGTSVQPRCEALQLEIGVDASVVMCRAQPGIREQC